MQHFHIKTLFTRWNIAFLCVPTCKHVLKSYVCTPTIKWCILMCHPLSRQCLQCIFWHVSYWYRFGQFRLRNSQKQKNGFWTNFRWLDRFIRSNKNLECTFVHFCIFYLFYLNFSIKMALSSFFDIFETWKYSWIFVLNL